MTQKAACIAAPLLLAACVHEGAAVRTTAQTAAPAPPVGPAPTTVQSSPAAPVNAPAPAAPESPPTASQQPTPASAAAPAARGRTAAPAPGASSTSRPPSTAPRTSTAPATTAPAQSPPVAVRPAPVPATAPPPGTLDLAGLEQRLRDTRAIGVFTKLSLKNQVDDLLAQFKAYHQGGSRVTLAQLRQKYEVLLMKVVTLLQDDDPSLATAVSSSRDAIWNVLTDPKKFANI